MLKHNVLIVAGFACVRKPDTNKISQIKARCLKMFEPRLSDRFQWAGHVLFRLGSASMLDQGLIKSSCDWLFLSQCEKVCWGMKVIPWLPRESQSIVAYAECKVQEMNYAFLSGAQGHYIIARAVVEAAVVLFKPHKRKVSVYFIRSLIKLETLRHCSASKPRLICSLSH